MKILLVQTSFLGDTILSTPVIAGLKKIYSQAEIWMMTTSLSKQLVSSDPMLSGVITYDKSKSENGLKGMWDKAKEIKAHNFDVVYSLHKSYRTALVLWLSGIAQRVGFKQAKLSLLYTRRVNKDTTSHDVLRNLSLLKDEKDFVDSGLTLENFFQTDLRLFTKDEDSVRQKFSEIYSLNKPIAVLVPGSAWKTKMWDWKGYSETAQYLSAKGYVVLLLGAPDEQEICARVAAHGPAVNLAGQTSIPESMAIIKSSALVVCNDSMSLHLASAFKIPNVAIFCATSPAFGFGPWKNKFSIVEKEGLPCKPCRRHGSNVCPTGTEACMKDLPSEKVNNAISALVSIGHN